MGYKKPSYEGENTESYRMSQHLNHQSLEMAYERLEKEYNKLKKIQVAPYCNSCLSQDVEANSRTVTCYNCGSKFPFKEIKR